MKPLAPLAPLVVIAALAAPLVASADEPATTKPWPVEPELGLSFSLAHESLSVTGATEGESVRAPSTLPAVTLGIRHSLWERRFWLHSALVVGMSTQDARGAIGLEEQGLFQFEYATWLGVGLGLGLRAMLDVASPAFSFGVASVPIALRVWRFEVVWSPGLQFPLGATHRDATGVEITQRMAVRFEPVSFALRFDFGPSP